MDGYKARKAPNVSHYLANLNALPSANEVATQQQEDFNIEDELAQFTNTEFLDFDAGDFLEQPMSEYDPGLEDKARRENAAANNKVAGKGMDFVSGMSYIATRSHESISSLGASTEDWHRRLAGYLNIHYSLLTQFHQATSLSPA